MGPLGLLTNKYASVIASMKVEDDTLNFTRMFRKEKGPSKINHYGRIIVSGMGGSGISGDIASAMCNSLQVPSVDTETEEELSETGKCSLE